MCIGDWGDVQGGRQRSPHLIAGALRPYLRVANVLDGYIDTRDVLSMHFTDDEYARYRLQPGDILLNEGQSLELVGRSATYRGDPESCAFQNTLIRFRAGPECDPAFAQVVFRHLFRTGVLSGIAKRTTSIAHLGVKRFAALMVVVPTRAEQQAIARYENLVRTSVEELNTLIIAKRKFKRGLAQQLLTGKRRLSEFQDKPWSELRLGEVFDERLESGRSDLPLLSVTRDRGVVPRDRLRKRDSSNPDKSKYKRVATGDIAYNTMRMWQGVSALSALEGIVSPAYTVIVPGKRIDGRFVKHLFKLPAVVHVFHRHSQGLVDDTLNLKFSHFARIRLRIPPDVAEQRRIADVLDLCDAELALLEQQRDLYVCYKRGLMSRLLSGEIKVPA